MWVRHYLFAVLSFFLAVVLISRLLTDRHPPGSTAAWLLLMIFLPHIGVPLFLILGSRKLERVRRKKQLLYPQAGPRIKTREIDPIEKMLLSSGIKAKSNGNEVDVLRDGAIAYDTVVELLKNAKESISITTFILKLDAVGLSIVKILEQKAQSGVRVQVLLDGLGSFWTFRWQLRKFTRAGGEIAFFLPLFHIPFFGHSNLRNHRKLIIADSQIAILGGMNLAIEYMGRRDMSRNSKQWVDISFRIQGPAVSDLEEVFRADWAFATHQKRSVVTQQALPRAVDRAPPKSAMQVLQVVASGPDVPGDPLYDAITLAVFGAKERVWIATPYFIPDETLSKALELAAKRGVDVRLLIPRRSNHLVADICRSGYLRTLEQAGGQIYYYSESMMHAKLIVVDDLYALVGSANLDMRSLLLNFELGLVLYSSPAIATVAAWYESRVGEAQKASIRSYYGCQLIEGVGRILGPVL